MPEASPTFKYLRPSDIRRLQSFEFAPKLLVEGFLSGRHRSQSKGPSIEFHDYRQYTQGDDPAQIDWRVYGRTDRHYLRTFELETNMECQIFVDSSASMGFGESVRKIDYASFFAAALAYLAVKHGDRVGMLLFDENLRKFFTPGSTMSHLHELLHALERNEPGKETLLSEALRRGQPLLKRKGTLVILSDLFDDPAAVFSALSPYLHRGFRVHLFHLLDPAELDLGATGLATMRDMETGARLTVHTDTIRNVYREEMQRHIESLRALARSRGVDYALARTDRPFFELLGHFSERGAG